MIIIDNGQSLTVLRKRLPEYLHEKYGNLGYSADEVLTAE
jgi:hypothetical protein